MRLGLCTAFWLLAACSGDDRTGEPDPGGLKDRKRAPSSTDEKEEGKEGECGERLWATLDRRTSEWSERQAPRRRRFGGRIDTGLRPCRSPTGLEALSCKPLEGSADHRWWFIDRFGVGHDFPEYRTDEVLDIYRCRHEGFFGPQEVEKRVLILCSTWNVYACHRTAIGLLSRGVKPWLMFAYDETAQLESCDQACTRELRKSAVFRCTQGKNPENRQVLFEFALRYPYLDVYRLPTAHWEELGGQPERPVVRTMAGGAPAACKGPRGESLERYLF